MLRSPHDINIIYIFTNVNNLIYKGPHAVVHMAFHIWTVYRVFETVIIWMGDKFFTLQFQSVG